MKSKMFLCAQDVLLNAYSNEVSVINLYENTQVREFPLAIARMMWLNVLEREPSEPSRKEFNLQVDLDGEVVYDINVLADFGGGLTNRCLAVMVNMTVPGPCLFRTLFRDGQTVVSSHEFQIVQMPNN